MFVCFGFVFRVELGFFFISVAGMVRGSVKVSATAHTGRSMASMPTPQPAQTDLDTKSRAMLGGFGIWEKQGAGPENASER